MAAPEVRPKVAALTVINPSGNRTRVAIEALPSPSGGRPTTISFCATTVPRAITRTLCGRPVGLLDGGPAVAPRGVGERASDCGRQKLANGDRIEFGVEDSYHLIFTLEEDELHRLRARCL